MKKNNLGNALIKSKNKKKIRVKEYIEVNGAEKNNLLNSKPKLQSVLDRNNLDAFLYEVEIAQKKFEAVKEKKIIVKEPLLNQKLIKNEFADVKHEENELIEVRKQFNKIRIPRKPDWKNKEADVQKLDENKAFIEWCKSLAFLKEKYNLCMTPYEKNVEVWKQFWITLEKSDILIQVVDARDPTFFKNEDINNYVKELDSKKQNFLLLNKSDLINDEIKKLWYDYFKSKDINFIFFSSKFEQEKIDTDIEDKCIIDVKTLLNSDKTLNRTELISLMRYLKEEHCNKYDKKSITIGTVGFPNVGKSSFINVLVGKKLVGVDSRPGKTKNYQTLFLEKDLILCDCPGLVFPSILSNTSEMVCNGVIPIDNLSEFKEHLEALVKRVGLGFLKKFYNLKVIGINGKTFLQSYAGSRGYVNGSGQADEFKSAKSILKDLINGKISYSILPDNSIYNNNKYNFSIEEEIKLIKNLTEHDRKTIFKIKNFDVFEKLCGIKQDIKIEFDKDLKESIIQNLEEKDILDLLKGKLVKGIKLTKDQKRDLKFLIKQNKSLEELEEFIRSIIIGSDKAYNINNLIKK